MESTECATDRSANSSNSCSCGRASGCGKCRKRGINAKRNAKEKPTSSCSSPTSEDQPFSKLPKEIITHIFKFLSYDQIAQLRPICKTFDVIGQSLLNEGFYKLGELHSKSLKRIKAQLPRRESERRTHRLALYGDILTGIETRLNLLSMTYTKYIDRSLCCFIPGRVIDEVRRLIRFVNKKANAELGAKALRESKKDREFPREHHELLQELRDISSMAMEHFEESILPRLRTKISDPYLADIAIPEAKDTVLGFTPGFRIATGSPIGPPCTVSVYQTLAELNQKVAKLESKTKELEKRDREKDKKLREYHDRLASNTASMAKLIGKIAELENQTAETPSPMPREDSCDSSTRRRTRLSEQSDSSHFDSEYQQRPKRCRRGEK